MGLATVTVGVDGLSGASFFSQAPSSAKTATAHASNLLRFVPYIELPPDDPFSEIVLDPRRARIADGVAGNPDSQTSPFTTAFAARSCAPVRGQGDCFWCVLEPCRPEAAEVAAEPILLVIHPAATPAVSKLPVKMGLNPVNQRPGCAGSASPMVCLGMSLGSETLSRWD